MEERPGRGFVFGWKVIAYLFLAGIGGGASVIGAGFHFLYPNEEMVVRGGIILAAPLVALGCLLLLSDLGRPQAALRAFMRPGKAWISRGTFVLTMFMVLGAVQFGFSIWPFHGLKDLPSLHLAINILNGILGIFAVIYTGFLFDTTRSIPFWSTPILPLLFLVSGVSTGVFGLVCVLALAGTPDPQVVGALSHFDAFLIVFEGMILFFYLHGMHEVTAARASVRRLVRGDLAGSFWIGVALIGLVVPFVLEILGGSHLFIVLLASLSGLIGGICVRYVVVSGAVKAPLNAEGVLVYLSPRPE